MVVCLFYYNYLFYYNVFFFSISLAEKTAARHGQFFITVQNKCGQVSLFKPSVIFLQFKFEFKDDFLS